MPPNLAPILRATRCPLWSPRRQSLPHSHYKMAILRCFSCITTKPFFVTQNALVPHQVDISQCISFNSSHALSQLFAIGALVILPSRKDSLPQMSQSQTKLEIHHHENSSCIFDLCVQVGNARSKSGSRN